MAQADRSDRISVHVISDDERVREFARSLGSDRFHVTFSAHRFEALQHIRKHGADVAIIELELGGFAAAKDIRALPTIRFVRVVMLCDRPHDKWLSLQAGADAVLVKPLQDLSELQRAIASILPAST